MYDENSPNSVHARIEDERTVEDLFNFLPNGLTKRHLLSFDVVNRDKPAPVKKGVFKRKINAVRRESDSALRSTL